MLRFRAAYVSGPYRAAGSRSARRAGGAAGASIVPYGVDFVPVATAVAAGRGGADAGRAGRGRARQITMLDVIVERLHGQGPPAHQVWLPPLAEPPTLGELLGDARRGSDRRALAPPAGRARGRLTVPVGIVDRPYEQRRDPLVVELAGAGGNVVIVGGPRSRQEHPAALDDRARSRSPTPRARCSSSASTSAAARCARWRRCRTCRAWPVGATPRPSAARSPRSSTLLDEREARFAELGHRLDRRATGSRGPAGEFADDPFGDVFLVVDGWSTLRQEYEELEPTITNLAARGLGFGVHVVLTANRWAEIRINLRDLFGTRLELRLGDPTDSEIDRRAAVNVPEQSPGRGLTRDKLHFLAAVPRIDGRRAVEDLAEASVALVEQVRGGLAGRAGAEGAAAAPTMLPVAELAQVVDPAGTRPADRPQRGRAGAGVPRPRRRTAPDRLRRRRVRQDQPAAADRPVASSSGTPRTRPGW